MGGPKGGGTQTVTQNADPWAGAQPYMTQALHDLQQTYQYGRSTSPNAQGYGGQVNVPAYYPGSTVASMSPYTQSAIAMQAARGAAGSPLTDAAQGQLTSTMRGDYLNSNPYLQGAINSATRPMVENYQTNIAPGVDSAFSSAGRYGSGAHTQAATDAGTALNRSVGDVASNMAFNNYNAERQRQNEGLFYAPQLAQQDYFDINQLGASGSALDAFNQALLNADIERYNYNQNAPWLRTQDFLNSVSGVGGTGSSGMSRGSVSPNIFSSALGTGLGLAGLANMFGLFGGGAGTLGTLAGGLAFSDENLKYDAEEVGELHNGLPLYEYHYKWEGENQPKHIGVMAQDALHVNPGAVGVDPESGFLMVDYAKVTK